MKNELLPIGTVCTLKGGEKKLMITAFLVSHENEEFDYCGCLYPEGMIDSSEHYLFNKGDIQEIHHMGLINEEEKEFKRDLSEYVNSTFGTTETIESLEIVNKSVEEQFLDIPILAQQANISGNSNTEIDTL